MSYIGNTSTTQTFAAAIDTFNGDGTTTAFTLSRPVATVAQIEVVVNNVQQAPGSYTVSGNTLTFTGAPSSGTANIYVYYTSPVTQVISPSTGTVGASQLDIANFNGTGAMLLPSGTTAQRPGSPIAGELRYNSTIGAIETYINNAWGSVAVGVYTMELLLVAGGGGGGVYCGGGGGAGGLVYSTAVGMAGSQYTVVIGSGGAGGTGSGNTPGVTGGNTTVTNTPTAYGGGGGAYGQNGNASTGLSGGSGGGSTDATNASGTSGQGTQGGQGTTASSQGGGGGGGAGVAGGNGSVGVGGTGGNGLNTYSTWATATSTGASGYYAGGGGGGDGSGGSEGTGGLGGGGTGQSTSGTGSAGTANTGGGGGGGGYPSVNAFSGGSGIVIIRYAGSQRGTGGTVTSTGGYTYHTFTTSGTYTA